MPIYTYRQKETLELIKTLRETALLMAIFRGEQKEPKLSSMIERQLTAAAKRLEMLDKFAGALTKELEKTQSEQKG